jgi:hypothetical protein
MDNPQTSTSATSLGEPSNSSDITFNDRVQALAQELFSMIYDYTFTSDGKKVTITKHYKPPAQLQVSRATRERFAAEFYNNTFCYDDLIVAITHLRTLEPAHCETIKRMVFKVCFCDEDEVYFEHERGDAVQCRKSSTDGAMHYHIYLASGNRNLYNGEVVASCPKGHEGTSPRGWAFGRWGRNSEAS